jgi:hypothetical protein
MAHPLGSKPMRATGTFDVKLSPLPAYAEGSPLARMSIDKQFQGDLTGISKGEMLATRSPVSGSAGYVALEHVTATLHGKAGSFVLQHSSTMYRGAATQSVTVVPDSGTGELVGLAGSMLIIIEGKTHSYEFDYSLTTP